MKTYNKHEYFLKNYGLGELMLRKVNGRNKSVGNNYSVNSLLNMFLIDYGISIIGYTVVNELEFNAIKINNYNKFPIENEPLFCQLYAYENIDVEISLNGFDYCSYSFNYNTNSGVCNLHRNVWGAVTDEKTFNTFEEMILELREKGYEKIFE